MSLNPKYTIFCALAHLVCKNMSQNILMQTVLIFPERGETGLGDVQKLSQFFGGGASAIRAIGEGSCSLFWLTPYNSDVILGLPHLKWHTIDQS